MRGVTATAKRQCPVIDVGTCRGTLRGERKAGDDHGAPTLDRRKALFAVLLALILAGAAFTIIGQVAHFGTLRRAIAAARTEWVAIAFGAQLLAYVGYVLAYRDAARASGGPRFNIPTTTRIVVFGLGASILGASVGGLAVDFWAIRRAGAKPHVAARRVLALGTLEWTFLSTYACAAAAVALIAGARVPLSMACGWLVVVPACVLAGRWFSSPKRVRRFIELPRGSECTGASGLARLRGAVTAKVRTALADAIAGVVLVRHLLSHPLRYHGEALGYPLYWAADILVLYAGIRAFGVPPGLAPLVLAYATSFVISALPLPAGGAGGVDAGMALALHAVGIGLAPAVLAVLVYRLITFWLPVIPALALLPSLRQLNRQLPTIPHSETDLDERVSFRPRVSTPGRAKPA